MNSISYYLEVAYDSKFIGKPEAEEYNLMLKESRKSLKSLKFEKFVKQLSELQLKIRTAINDSNILIKFDKAFDSCY